MQHRLMHVVSMHRSSAAPGAARRTAPLGSQFQRSRDTLPIVRGGVSLLIWSFKESTQNDFIDTRWPLHWKCFNDRHFDSGWNDSTAVETFAVEKLVILLCGPFLSSDHGEHNEICEFTC